MRLLLEREGGGYARAMVVDERNMVLEGRDGFLFLINDSNQMLEQHIGALKFSDEQLEQWRALLESRSERVAAVGGRYVLAVAPDTPSVYGEKLPPEIEPAERRPVHQLIEYLESCGSPARVLYPDEELIAHKHEQLVCERVGTHWTDFGAFLAYRFLIDALDGTIPSRELTTHDVYYLDATVPADLGNKLGPPRDEAARLAGVVHHASHPVYDNCVRGGGSLLVTECDVAPPTRCVLLGDSYMYPLLKFFSETFGRIAFAHRPTMPDDLLVSEQPDIVISVMGERALIRIPDDDCAPTQGELEDEKRMAKDVRGPYAPFGSRPNLATVAQVEAMRARMLGSGRLCDATIVSLMAYAMLRPKDVLSLRWSHIRAGGIEVTGDRRVPLWPVVVEDLERWRGEQGGGKEHVIFDPGETWGVADWQKWRDRWYTPVVSAFGLGRLPPWGLHNTYVHLRLMEGATPAELAAESGAAIPDYAVARAHVAAADGRFPGSADAAIRAARRTGLAPRPPVR